MSSTMRFTASLLLVLTVAWASIAAQTSTVAKTRNATPKVETQSESQTEPKEGVADEPVKIGSTVDGLRFVDLRYLTRSLDDFGKDVKAYAIVFTNLECPIARRYLPRLKKLDEAYRDKGVQFLSLNVGTEESIVEVAAQAVKAKIAFPFGKDFDGEAARKLGATRTPEVVLLDADKRIRYRGRIDGGVRFGGVVPGKTREDLKEAVEDVLAGRDVQMKETPVDGCLISFPKNAPPRRTVTYAEHIAPLLQKHCQECHRPEAEGPFSLLSYADAKKHSAMIGEVVKQRRMPPWFASEAHGKFINTATLSGDERRLVADWIASGAPEGDPGKLPEPRKFRETEWEIGKPDLVIRAATVQKVPAEGYIPYRYIVLPYIFTRDTWVQKIEIKPGNRRVVHHCNMGYITMVNGKPKSHFITGFVPGGTAMVLDKGTGFMIPKGAVLGLQMHYVTTGEETTDRTSVGFSFPEDGKIDRRIQHLEVTTRRFEIPPGDPHHPVVAKRTLNCDAVGIGMFVHMHLRGKDMTFRAKYPDGKTETLLVVPNYSFDWQINYRWKLGAKTFPKGTQIECVAHFDNSPFNPYNPNPKDPVKFGLQTYHEMMYGFFFYLDRNEKRNLQIDPKTGYVVDDEQ